MDCTAMNDLIHTIQGCLIFSGIMTFLIFIGLVIESGKDND